MKIKNEKGESVSSKEVDRFLSEFFLLCRKHKKCLVAEKNHLTIQKFDKKIAHKMLSNIVIKNEN